MIFSFAVFFQLSLSYSIVPISTGLLNSFLRFDFFSKLSNSLVYHCVIALKSDLVLTEDRQKIYDERVFVKTDCA
jgi:hypothetical protein